MKQKVDSVPKNRASEIPKRKRIVRRFSNTEMQSVSNPSKSKKASCRKDQSFFKSRIEYLKKPERVLASYFSCLSFNFMAIYNATSIQLERKGKKKKDPTKKLQVGQLSDFLQGQKWLFLQILKLMTQDRYLSIAEMLQTVYEENLLTEKVPGTLVFGLCQLRRQQEVKDPDEWIQLKLVEIKCFYIISVLLTVRESDQIFNQIDYPEQTASEEQTISLLFQKIVQKLLSETKLLTPIIFEELVEKWQTIILTIQFHLSQKSLQQSNRTQCITVLGIQAPPSVEAIKKLFGKASKQQLHKCQQNVKSFIQQVQSSEKKKMQKRHLIREGYFPFEIDHFESIDDFLAEQEHFFVEQIEMFLQQPNTIQRNKDHQLPEVNSAVNLARQQSVQSKPLKISIRLAQKRFNYGKRYTRDRTQQTLNKKKLEKSQKSFEPKESSEELVSSFLNESNSALHKKQFLEESTFNHHALISVEESHQSLGTSQKQNQSQKQNTRTPYHNIPHQNREVDTMINQLINQEMAIARSVANEIYHALESCRIQLEIQNK